MASIHVGIGHDDEFMVAELGGIERFRIFRGADLHAEGVNMLPDLFVIVYLMLHRFFHVQDLTRSGRMPGSFGRGPVCPYRRPNLLRRGRVRIYRDPYRCSRPVCRTKPPPVKYTLALHHFRALRAAAPGLCGQYHFLDDGLGFFRILLEVCFEHPAERGVYHPITSLLPSLVLV